MPAQHSASAIRARERGPRPDCRPAPGAAVEVSDIAELSPAYSVVIPTEGSAVSHENHPDHHIPTADEPSVPELEVDETIAPRPEEEIADVLRAEPDLEDHSRHPEA